MDYTALFSGLTGTLLGGTITWLNTKYSLNMQFREQEKRTKKNRVKRSQTRIHSFKCCR